MDPTSIRCLINTISRFILQVSCQTKKPTLIQKDYRSMVTLLKHLKPVLDEVVDYNIPSAETLYKECEELDLAVNEAREFMENWHPVMSKILTVWRCDCLFKKIRTYSLQICQTSYNLLRSSLCASSLRSIQELRSLESEMITKHIEEAIQSKRNDDVTFTDHLSKIVESLNLASENEFLKESIAIEKERMDSQVSKSKPEMDLINQIPDLMSSICNFLLKSECFEPKSGIPIPSYFRCPLSLELMLDPVILASGQTFERASIQKWLDNGLTTCPKTRKTLSHTNLIPNYTVKAMIANWSEENHLKFSGNIKQTSPSIPDVNCSVETINSTSKSEVGNGFENHTVDISSKLNGEESNGYELSYTHSRSESTTSAISSIEYTSPSLVTNEIKHEKSCGFSGEITSQSLASFPNKESGASPWLSETQFHISKANPSRDFLPANSDDPMTSQVKKLVNDLKSQSNMDQRNAASELRNLSKNKTENRNIIGRSGAVIPLLQLLYSDVKITQEHAVTALLNLSISEEIKAMIAEAGAIEPLIHVLKSGNDAAKENSAAALFSLSVLEEYKAKIGRSGAVKALVNLLASGTLRGKKDAATALFNLSILHENKARIVQAGAVKYLVELMDPETSMVDKAVALLANLSTIGEGRTEIVRAGGIPLLVEIVETGSQRGKENAASVVLQLCLNSPKFCTLVLQEGAVPPLVALSQTGTTRAKEKAQQLLSHFRNQREGSMGKSK